MLLQLILAFIVFDYVNGDNTKGSLTFVIDETRSMADEIDQVKEQTNQVFDAVLSSNASKIDDFIIVTFDDPNAHLKIVTRDRHAFKDALADITVHGNPDCPEYAMKGIELALKHSKPNSFFYVFTDAAAKDYEEYDRIKSLGLKKSIQVTFLLTGICNNSLWEANAVYDKLAAATNGQVFHLEKQDIRKIMPYIIASVNHMKTTIAHKVFSNGFNKKLQFSIDSKLWDVIISVSGINPKYHITDPDDQTVEVNTFITTEKSHVSKLEAKPGVYTMHLDSVGATSIVITASTSVSFQHGFSTIKPTTLNETSTKPISGLPTYLSIALDNIDKDVSLDTIEIRDINDNVISELPLTLIDKNQPFYVTKPLLTPNSTFKLAINGHTKSNEKITRVASTAIEPQKPELEGPENKKPSVTILEGDKMTVEYDTQITLKCKVNAYPKPDVIWQDNLGTPYSSTIVPVDLPYEYMSILIIEKVDKNVTIQCRAVSLLGEDTKYIAVESKRSYFINILEFPKDTTIEYGAPAELNLKVNAFPLVNITWFKNGKQIKNNSDYEVSSDGSRVAIRQMRNELKGKYTVEAYNDVESKNHEFKLDMSGVVPVIDKSISEYEAKKGLSVNISCRILKSKPTPAISWTFKSKGLEIGVPLRETRETIHLNNVGLEHIGIYSCVAQNEFGKDSHEVDFKVVYPPSIQKVKTQIQVPIGELVILTCKVDGFPFPIVRWFFNKVEIEHTGKYTYNDNSLSFIGSVADDGIYTCEASNSVGEAKKDFYVNIYVVPVIDKSVREYKAKKGFNVNISCRILKSKPTPAISWTFKSKGLEIGVPLRETRETIHLNNVGLEHIGIYSCVAQNEFGKDSHEVDFKVVYPPSIQKVKTQIQVPIGELVILTCKVDGFPFPIVRWFFNKVEIEHTGKYTYNDNSLSFIGSVADDGIYTCEASNSVGEAKKDFYVNIYVVPVIDKSVREYKAKKGFNVNISCRILKSKPTPAISWTFKSKGLEIGVPLRETRETIHLNNVGLEHIGIYSCVAQNEFGKDSHEVDFKVVYPPSIQKVKTQIQVPIGELVILTCKVDGFPFPIVRWFFNKVEIEHTGKYTYNDNSLSFIGSVADDGIYTCEASNSVGEAKKDFYVNIYVVPVIDKSVREYKAKKGFNVNISCRILKSKPTPAISWTFKSKGLEIGVPLRETRETIHLNNVGLEHIGIYSCVAQNEFGKDSHEVDFKVVYPPSIQKVKTQIQVPIGELVILTCKVDGFPFPIVRWFFNKVEIEHTGKYTYNDNSLSFIGSVADDGIYTCEASNSVGEAKKDFYVNIYVVPVIDKSVREYKAKKGFNVNISCRILKSKPTPAISWTFKSKGLEIGVPLRETRETIHLNNVGLEHIGIYSCVAQNEFGKDSHEVDFKVVYPPSIQKVKTQIQVPIGELVILTCKVDGFPFPIVRWFFNKVEIEHTGKYTYNDNSLSFIGSVADDGIYTCEASNSVGEAKKDFYVNIYVVPVIDKSVREYKAKKGFNVNISCRILKSKPTPAISWTFKSKGLEIGVPLRETRETIHLNNVGLEHIGIYSCVAQNEFGKDSHEVDFKVVYPPSIQKVKTQIQVPIGELVILTCKVDGFPFPIVRWFFNKVEIEHTGKYTYNDNSLSFIGSVADDGIYTCEASNSVGEAKKDFYVNIYVVPVIDKSVREYKAKKGFNVNISCRILKSKPTPAISWTFKSKGLEIGVPLRETRETIHLNNVGLEHIGIYSCVAQNEFGKDSHEVDFKVVYPPSIQKVKTQIQVPIGELVILTCKVDGFPFPIVRWFFNKVEIEHTGKYTYNDNSLSFIGSVADDGIYTCEASNSVGEAKKDFYVNIYVVPVIDKSVREYKAKKGFNVNISCRILKSKPTPAISWTFKSKGLEIGVPLRETRETIHLNNVGLEHIGIYSCVAQNEFGKDSHEVDFKVVYPPSIQKVKTQIQVPIGELVILTCKVDGFPFPIVRWFFNKVEIEHTGKYTYNDNSLSFIGSVADDGIYTCEASNSVGEAKKDFYVNIYVVPVIDKSVREYKAKKGFNVNISCRILKSKPTPAISWTFQPKVYNIRMPLRETTETLNLNNVSPELTGIYSCVAQNEFGKDSHEVDFKVVYPPTIKKVKTQIQLPKGELVILTCKVDGFPFPIVRWFFNKVEVEHTGKYTYNDNSLSFIGSVADDGIYTCEASNSVGEAKKDFYVNIYISIKIAKPKKNMFELTVGDSVNLTCEVEGYPKPKVQWRFFSENPSIPPKYLRTDSTVQTGQYGQYSTLFVKNIQVEDEGIYRCIASKVGKSKNIHYQIRVKETVSILANTLGVTSYDAVKGDLALRIPCKAKGNPKPVVTWETKGYNIASGTNWFDIKEDGTLAIKYPTLNSTGSYICRASNAFSSDSKTFNVNVTQYPQVDNVLETLYFEIGTSPHVECGLPHGYGDIANWFKDGRLIASDELYLKNITKEDSGVYSCRVSTLMSAHTIHKNIIVGYKPYFKTEGVTNIHYIEGKVAFLNCFAYGEPKPQIIWRHNGNIMKTSDITYIFEMKPDDIGNYQCVLSNKFGNINRTFNIMNT